MSVLRKSTGFAASFVIAALVASPCASRAEVADPAPENPGMSAVGESQEAPRSLTPWAQSPEDDAELPSPGDPVATPVDDSATDTSNPPVEDPSQGEFEALYARWVKRGSELFVQGMNRLPPPARARVRAEFRRIKGWWSEPANVELTQVAVLVALLLLMGVRLLRRPGDVAVCIEYPSELRGKFTISLHEKKGRRRSAKGSQQGRRGRRVSTRTDHYMVSRETRFAGLRARNYWITVEGALKDPSSNKILKQIFEERGIGVKRGETVPLEVDLWTQGCPVEVSVLWDKRPAREASASIFGQPYTLRYARGGIANLELPLGAQRIVIGGGDRVAEIELEVMNHQPLSVTVDLGSPENIVFKGCPLAVEPYLQGDLALAARELEREGLTSLANLLLARLHQAGGQTQRAVEHFVLAGEYREAAVLLEGLSASLRAGELYLRAGSEEDRRRGVALLEAISSEEVGYAQACTLLAQAYDIEGQADTAIVKLEAALGCAAPEDAGTGDLRSRLSELIEARGEEERALEILEGLRDLQPDYPNLTARIESLRKQISVERMVAAQSTDSQATVMQGSGSPMSLSGSRYDILEQVGRGGMGVVFKARDRRLGRLVALKQLPEGLREHPTAVELFLSEARSVAILNHPNIVTLYDADQEGDKFFITMELLEGKPLSRILRKHGPIAPRDCARLGLQVAIGLQYAHAQRIVHRDIKLSNLFYTKDKVVKIMDFGIAKVIEEVRRGTTVMGGTPNYMSPEQTLGQNVDARADIYAFGVTLFEMLTGKLPFIEGDVAYHHCHTPPPDPRSIVPEIPEEFVSLIFSMLEKDPEARCASAAEVATHLKRLAS